MGKLDTGSATSPVATVDVTFKSTGSTKQTCAVGSETVYTGTLAGDVSLVTGLTKAGTVGASDLTLNSHATELTDDYGCESPLTNPCADADAFASGLKLTTPVASGGDLGEGLATEVGVEHEVKLKAPAGAVRFDVAAVQTAAPSWDAATGVLSVTTTSDGLITGSATLSGAS